jgi:hypothetical protein
MEGDNDDWFPEPLPELSRQLTAAERRVQAILKREAETRISPPLPTAVARVVPKRLDPPPWRGTLDGELLAGINVKRMSTFFRLNVNEPNNHAFNRPNNVRDWNDCFPKFLGEKSWGILSLNCGAPVSVTQMAIAFVHLSFMPNAEIGLSVYNQRLDRMLHSNLMCLAHARGLLDALQRLSARVQMSLIAFPRMILEHMLR